MHDTVTAPQAGTAPRGPGFLRSSAFAVALIAAVTLGARFATLPLSTEANMDPDAAHFMNIARCFARGQGFSNPAAWPAWMKPERLPMPETFKEPGYPFAIRLLAPVAGGSFPAGQWISFLAGLAIPFLTWGLARRMALGRDVALLAALLAAASPLLIMQSVRVMVESVFTMVFLLVWITLLPRAGESARPPSLRSDLAAGVLLGIAFLLRGQTLMAAPAIAALILAGRTSWGAVARRAVLLLAVAMVVAAPFLWRNLQLFGVLFHSDVGSFGLWPYVDHLTFSHGLEHPPAVAGFVLHHVPEVAAHWIRSAVLFTSNTLPDELLGNRAWLLPLVVGVLVSLARWRQWLFVYVFLGVSLGFVFAVHWDSRYFTSGVPLWCLLIAMGGVWIARPLANERLVGALHGRHLLAGALVLLVAYSVLMAHRQVAGQAPLEIEAARAEAPFLRAHLAPDEAVMAVTTSLYSWFADRPSVHLVIADEPQFMEVVRRLHVRYAALPTSRLAEFAARYPERRLPAALILDHRDPTRDVSVYRVAPNVP